MQSPEAQGFARFGGFLLAISLILPYFALSVAGFTGMNFNLWRLDRAAFVMISIYAVIALAQVRFSNRETRALIYMIVGGLFTAALVYRLWISPPGSAPIGDLGGGGTLKIDGKETAVDSLSTKDLLAALGVNMKLSYGAYVAMVGSIFFTVGAFLEWRASGGQPSGSTYEAQLQHIQQVAAPQQQAYTPPAQPADVYTPPVDPFAAPAAQVPADPFAPPAAPPAPPTPPAPTAPPAAPDAVPQRPPGC